MAKSDGLAPAVFLDRDGTINEDPGYLSDPDRVRLFDGVPEALARLKSAGYRLVIVSNQSGIGRGLVTWDRLESVNQRVALLAGTDFDGIYACPHHPTEAVGEYRTACTCRKPATGLIDRAIDELGLDRGRSYLVGDSEVDVACGRAGGLTTILVLTGLGRATQAKVDQGRIDAPDHVVADLVEAARWIVSRATPDAGPSSAEMKRMHDTIERAFRGSAETFLRMASNTESVARTAELLIGSMRAGGKLLVFGNGGSAADAQHIAAELMGRFYVDRPSLPAIALTTNSSNLTAIANDLGFEDVFARQVEALARPGDVIMGISTSGNSENVARALEAANRIGARTVALTGAAECRLDRIAQIVLKVPSTDTPRIQEGHIAIGHVLCQLVESAFVAERWEPAGSGPAPR